MDISITNVKTHVFGPKTEAIRVKKALDILSHDMEITEKVDGTKLTLVRTEANDADYTKNWIVAYKGQILYAKEFGHISDKDKKDITKVSIGRAQYVLIFDHLKKINGKVGSIPSNTEFSVEFAQNKDTLTRTYENLGGMFLRSYGKVEYRIVAGKLYTQVVGEEVTDYVSVNKMANLLEIATFPVMFNGKVTQDNIKNYPTIASKMAGVDWKNPLDVLTKFEAAMLSIQSTLGGKTEGVVLKLDDGRFFKFVQADQYDTEAGARAEKQAALKIDPEAKTPYFQLIRSLINKIFKEVGTEGKTEEDIISDVNFYIAKNDKSLAKFFNELIKISGGKRSVMGVRDDIHDTIRTILDNETLLTQNKKTVALIPMGAKPFHKGHFELIELAAKECDNVIVFGSLADRKEKGEFPIKGETYLKFWHDMFMPILPKNVRFKFADKPISAVYMQLRWFEQSFVQDKVAPPIVRIYSDPEDLKTNWSDDVFTDPKRGGCPTLFNAGKIEKKEVARGSKTTDISGTKMRQFLQSGDKESFMNNLPPVTDKQKEEIWDTIIASKPKEVNEVNPYAALAETLINEVAAELLGEGGWRNPTTQDWSVTPKIVAKIDSAMDKFVSAFNAYSKLPPIKSNGPVGSGTYYKDDLNDPNASYGDVDIQLVLPVESNLRPDQLEANKTFSEKIREFIKVKKPSYIYADLTDPAFGIGYLIFDIDGRKIQVDLVLSYTVSADWTKVRTTPEKGLKGFVTGMMLSALSETINVVLGSSTNPYINTLNGKVVSSATKKGAVQHFLKPNEVFAEIARYYGKLAGVQNVNLSALSGYHGLDPQDPSLKKKCETVVALANALDQNGIFAKNVIITKDGKVIKSRKEFIDNVLNTFIGMMERAKTAKKLEKAQTPSAMKTIDKIKADADRGIQMAKQILRESIMMLIESGQSVAAVDDKTPKMVNGQPAQATTKLRIVDPNGKDIKNAVSTDVKELVHALNGKVRFWKKDSPYIENGFVFNGSSQYLMSGDEKYKELSKYKSSFGDIDVIVPKEKLDAMEAYLDSIDDKQVDWKPTPKNKVSKNFYYVGRTKSQRALAGQTVTLWYYVPTKQVVQIDFEGDEMILDPQGYEKPSEWIKFIKDSPYTDLQSGIKGLAGAILLRGLTRAATALPNAVYVTNTTAAKIESGQLKGLVDAKGKSVVSVNATHALPAEYTLNTSGSGFQGVRKAYRLVAKNMDYQGKKVDVYTDIPTSESKPEDRINSVSKVFELIFKRKPSADDLANFRSYVGLLKLMKTLPKDVQVKALERAKEGFAQSGLDPAEYAPIQKAAKATLGISI
jgi:hypothetical protein